MDPKDLRGIWAMILLVIFVVAIACAPPVITAVWKWGF